MRSSSSLRPHPPPHERVADNTHATYVLRFPSSCNPAPPPPLHTQRNAWRKPPSCPAHPDAVLDIPARTPPPSPRPDTDLPPLPPPSFPIAHPERCRPSEKTSTGYRSLKPPPRPPAPPSPLTRDPR